MDAHGQIGPEKGDYAADVVKVATRLTGTTAYVKLAHDGTRYAMLLALREDVSGDVEGVPLNQGFIHVALEGHGAYWFQMGGYLAPGYVQDKLTDITERDGENIAEFLTRLHLALTNNRTEVVA